MAPYFRKMPHPGDSGAGKNEDFDHLALEDVPVAVECRLEKEDRDEDIDDKVWMHVAEDAGTFAKKSELTLEEPDEQANEEHHGGVGESMFGLESLGLLVHFSKNQAKEDAQSEKIHYGRRELHLLFIAVERILRPIVLRYIFCH